MRQEGFFFSAVGGHGCCQKPTVWWESAPAVAINLNSRTNQRRRDDKASASPITTKQIGVIWCCCKSTKCIYCNNCEEVIFKRTHNAASGQQKTCCAILIHSSVTLFIHGERMSSKQCPSLYRLGKRKKKTHFDTYYDKQGWKSSHQYLLQERLRLLKDSDNKSSVLSARYANRSHIPSGLCGTIISSGPIYQGETCFWQSVPQRVTTSAMQITINNGVTWSYQ